MTAARDLDAATADIAAVQSGVFSRAQAMRAGASDQQISRRLASGRWIRRGPGVYGLSGLHPSFLQRLWIAHLAAGPHSVVSHEAAAGLHRLSGFPRRDVVLTVGHPAHARVADGTVHQISDLAPEHSLTLGELPVTTIPRTFVDLAAVVRRTRLADSLDDAVTARRTAYEAVGTCLSEVARKGKPGVRLLATLLDERGPGYVPPASKLERAMFAMLETFGAPPPRRQFPFPGRQVVTGCVDAAYPEARLIIEADGRRWHSRIADLARDHARDNEAARAGWQVLRLLHEDVTNSPEETCRLVRETRRIRLSQLVA